MKKVKKVKKNVVKKYISHQDNVDCLFEERKSMHTMQTIRSFNPNQGVCVCAREGEGVILPPCWFSLKNSETVKAETLVFCSI